MKVATQFMCYSLLFTYMIFVRLFDDTTHHSEIKNKLAFYASVLEVVAPV
jgi:hypothetical protein